MGRWGESGDEGESDPIEEEMILFEFFSKITQMTWVIEFL